MSEAPFVIPLSSAAATDVERVGPKAANLAALMRAGVPTPGGFCLGADAYRMCRTPMVVGVLDAARRIPDGSQVAVDGIAGIVRWIR